MSAFLLSILWHFNFKMYNGKLEAVMGSNYLHVQSYAIKLQNKYNNNPLQSTQNVGDYKRLKS